jgi:hypothetical protein
MERRLVEILGKPLLDLCPAQSAVMECMDDIVAFQLCRIHKAAFRGASHGVFHHPSRRQRLPFLGRSSPLGCIFGRIKLAGKGNCMTVGLLCQSTRALGWNRS